MDLLDNLDMGPAKSRTFKKTIDISIDNENSENEEKETSKASVPALKSIDISNNSILNTSKAEGKPPGVPSVAGLFSSAGSLLDKVKRRLDGESTRNEDAPTQEILGEVEFGEEAQTQQVEDEDKDSEGENELEPVAEDSVGEGKLSSQTQKIEASSKSTLFDASTQIISEPNTSLQKQTSSSPSFEQHPIETATLVVNNEDYDHESTEERDTVIKTDEIKTQFEKESENGDQVEEDDDEEEENIRSTHKRINKLFMASDSEEENEKFKQPDADNTTSTQSRLEKIEALVAKKRAERLLREQQQRDKEQKDLGDYKNLNDPVADEGNEDQEGDVSVSTIKPDKKRKSEAEEEMLEEQSEYISEQLQHEEKVIKTFDKNTLLAAFGLQNPLNPSSSPALEKSSPITSPISGTPHKLNQEVEAHVKAEPGKDVELSESSEEDDAFHVTDLFDEEKVKKMQDKEKPKFVVKAPFNKPDKNNNEIIEFDSDSDSDVEVAPSKVTRLEVKSKFSKQTISRLKAQKRKALSKAQLFLHLKEKSRLQLKKQNHDHEESHKAALEEVANEQEEVGKLLDRYIAAANRTREKEKEIAKQRKLAEEAGEEFDDRAYSDDSDVGEVPDSDIEDDENDEGEDDENIADSEESDQEKNDDDDDENVALIHKKHRRKGLVSDDDDDDNDADEDQDNKGSEQPDELKSKLERDQSELNINLGSFGGNFSQKGDFLNGNATQKLNDMLGISMTQVFETESPKVAGNSKIVNVFDQLRKNGNQVMGEESFVEASLKDQSFSYSINSQNQGIHFDEASTQFSEIEPPTQAFSITQRDSISTLHDSIPHESFEATIKDGTQIEAEDEVEDEEIGPSRKRLFKKHAKNLDDLSEEEEEETEEQIMERRRQVELMREKMRKRDLEVKRRKLEMKRKGLDKIMENEAEESEDEWQGIGGIDGERSDDENSEDEKMLDDYSKLKLNESQIAKLIANENLQNDEKMLHRILNDVNNGGFRKRGARNGIELELSDEEDTVLQNYNRMRNERMRARLMEDGNMAKLSKDTKAKAFFETIAEDSQNTANEVFGGMTDNDDEGGSDNEVKDEDPFNDKLEITKDDFKDPSTTSKKRKITLNEAFVHEKLSFLNDEEDEIEKNAAIAARQHGFDDDDDDDFVEDLSTLKQRSVISLPDTTPQRKSTIDITSDSDQSPEKFFKMPSKIMKSFQSNSNDSFKNSNEVTVSTAYKAATSSKASIMSFGKNNSTTKVPTKVTVAKSQDTRVLKVRKVEKTLKKRNRLRRLDVGNFE